MISKQEVEHIAKLARLELTEEEVKKMQKDLSEILEYFNILKKAPQISQSENLDRGARVLRKDEVFPSYDVAKKLIVVAPNKKDGYIKVKAVL